MKKKTSIVGVIICTVLILTYNYFEEDINKFTKGLNDTPYNYTDDKKENKVDKPHTYSDDIKKVIDYDGVNKYVVINNNEPNFLTEDLSTQSFEFYSDLDSLGRCGVAMANIGIDLMPTEERGEIGQVKPSGWYTIKYDFISGKYLYNRCHLIGYQLTGENANEKNLITCTRSTNIGIMLEYENMVASYIKETNNHVFYRVTPVFKDDNLVASGIQMEGLSIEDNGEGIKFNVYIYNIEDGVTIDYKTGESEEAK